jgi:60 kDa SS-A/Ro ribonucleoprotein
MRELLNTMEANSHPGRASIVDDWATLDRFLVFGSESGTYNVAESKITPDSAMRVQACLKADGSRVVDAAVAVSVAGVVPKHTPAIFVLALAASPNFADAATNRGALAALPLVARTGKQLCEFAAFAQNLRGWGRGLRSAIGKWYVEKPVRDLACEMLSEEQHGEWSHRDLLRLAHPKASTAEQNALFQWAVEREIGHLAPADLPMGNLRQLYAVEQARKAHEEHEVAHLIEEFALTPEMIPGEWKSSTVVWEALLHDMPYATLLENLGTMTEVGVLAPMAPATALAITRLTDGRRVRQSGVHPIAVLSARLAYQAGGEPVRNIVDALDEAFYLATDNVEPTGKRIYLGISGKQSMQGTGRNAYAAALALAFARTERGLYVSVFDDNEVRPVEISKGDRLEVVCEGVKGEACETAASLAIQDALERDLPVDTFVIVTDSETWSGDCDPGRAILAYREKTGITAKLAVIAMTADTYSTADPSDPLQIAVAGFDATVPVVVSNFIR